MYEPVRDVASMFGVTATEVSLLAGEVDRTYALTDANGERYVLKAAAGESEQRLQNEILEHLAAKALPFDTPRVRRTADGDDLLLADLGDGPRVVRLLSWVEGTMLSALPFHSPGLLEEWGLTAARMVEALADFASPLADRTHHWDLRSADSAVNKGLSFLKEARPRQAVEQVLHLWRTTVAPVVDGLPTAVVHHDLTDFNVLAAQNDAGSWSVAGVVDVGDAMRGLRVAEVVVTAAYAALRKDDPLAAARHVVAGFNQGVPLTDGELEVLFPLMLARLCTNATTWTSRTDSSSDNAYGNERMRHTWPAIEHLLAVEPLHAEATFRAACGRQPHPRHDQVIAFLRGASPVPVVDLPGPPVVVDLSVAGDADVTCTGQAPADAPAGSVTRSPESRPELAGQRRSGALEPATVRLGSDVFVVGGSEVRAPLGAEVVMADAGLQVVLLRHQLAPDLPLWTAYRGVVPARAVGDVCRSGDKIGIVGGTRLHLQLSCSPSLPPVQVRPSERAVWESTSPDPATLLLGAPPPDADRPWGVDRVLAVRERRVARSQLSYYRRPPNLVRASGVWFTDDDGFSYLDAVNNVTHVGHAHPRVVEAAHRQMHRLNTNSRFVYEGLARYADRLAGTFPAPLEVVFFVCTGSEANDLALRMARACTGRTDVVVIDGAYHGNTTAVTGISPNRYKGPGGSGPPPTTHEVPQPNRYRGPFGYHEPDAGAHYAAQASEVIARLVEDARPPAAVIAESLIGTGGQVVLPAGYLAGLFGVVRAAGGLCISDEVQVGMGRLGERFWGFELQGVTPDIVTIGKPIGNGHPMAAVVTTREIADAFDNGMRYFNTFAGNPVSCAVGMAVLDVMEDEQLQGRALDVGGYLRTRLTGLQDRHLLIGDVRGEGLYLGVELVRDRLTKAPAKEEAYLISERMKDEGVIVYPNGELDNVLKLKPPMVFGEEHADLVVDSLDRILAEGW